MEYDPPKANYISGQGRGPFGGNSINKQNWPRQMVPIEYKKKWEKREKLGHTEVLKLSSSWIIPLSKWLVTESPNISHSGHLEGKQPYLGDLPAMVINHLLIWMILQVQMCKSVGKPIVGHVGPEDGNIFFY